MPTGPHGQAHTGTYGLFDDPDELAQTIALEETHEIHRLEGQIRRQERRDRHEDRKEEKAAKRKASRRAPKSKISLLFGKIFGGKYSGSIRKPARLSGSDDEDAMAAKEAKGTGYKIVRRPVTPETVYHAEDVEAVDSLWLRECGMVKVKSDGGGGCHIVSKTDIEKSE
jgi:hypothetical protein